jgi:hypothetical protein
VPEGGVYGDREEALIADLTARIRAYDGHMDAIEVRKSPENPELIKPVKPDRRPDKMRIDAVVTAALAVGAWRVRGAIPAKRSEAIGF